MKLSFKKLVFVLVILFLTISTLSLNNVIANDNDSIKETEESFEKLEEQNVFTVKFNSNSENQIDAQEVAGNQKIKQPIELIKRGYSFKGWFIDENFTTRWNFEQDVVTENLTLYAKWEVQEFVITFKDYDGTELSNQTIEYGKGAVAPKDPIREKYNFIGWDKDFTNVTTDLIIKAKYELNEFVRLNNLSITGDYYTKARLTISADGTSTNGVLYQYWVKDLEENRWKMIKDYSESKSATWVPGKAGDYLYGVHIKDKNSGERLDTHLYKDITIKGPLIGRTIMLDPGHGGYDPGAVNNTLGIKEKDYNNALSMKIREKLISLGANVTFTRNPWEDKYIHLHDRTPIVNEAKPDIMISIHHDSSTNKNASGMSVHYSSYRPGLDTSNAYVLYKGKEYKFVREIKDWLDPIRKTRDPGIVYLDNGKEKIVNIKDVMVYDNRNPQDVAIESEKLAESLYSSLGKLNYNKYYSYIKDHNLHMTRWSNVPSALIEAGFISNNEEAKRINKPEERNKIAQTIVDAIVSYFN
jgi:uncharacterized repeat protein (TIGR02543 family)